MRRIRFNIASMLGIILVLGVGFAALRQASDLWDSGVFTVTLGVLSISILLAIHRTDKSRAFWLGLALFGSAYLGLSLVPTIESRLITNRALAYLDSKVPGRSLTTIGGDGLRIWGTASGTFGNDFQNLKLTADGDQVVGVWDATTGKLLGGWRGTTEHFVRIGHSLVALLVGWFGGQLSRRLCRSSRSSEPSTAVEVEGTDK